MMAQPSLELGQAPTEGLAAPTPSVLALRAAGGRPPPNRPPAGSGGGPLVGGAAASRGRLRAVFSTCVFQLALPLERVPRLFPPEQTNRPKAKARDRRSWRRWR